MSIRMETPTVRAKLRATVIGGNGRGVTHRWDGSVLTISSDSGTSAADLLGPKGEDALMVITVEPNAANDGLVANKTYGEVLAAVEAGRTVAADLVGSTETTRHYLTAYGEGGITFTVTAVGDFFFWQSMSFSTIILKSDNTVSWAWESEFLPEVSDSENGKVLTVVDGSWKAAQLPAPAKATQAQLLREGAQVTVTVSFDDGSTRAVAVALDENDYPVSVTAEGVSCGLSWEGFAE